jgi:hypothetical protein
MTGLHRCSHDRLRRRPANHVNRAFHPPGASSTARWLRLHVKRRGASSTARAACASTQNAGTVDRHSLTATAAVAEREASTAARATESDCDRRIKESSVPRDRPGAFPTAGSLLLEVERDTNPSDAAVRPPPPRLLLNERLSPLVPRPSATTTGEPRESSLPYLRLVGKVQRYGSVH